MGTIYRVRHRLLDEVRVVKVMNPQALASEEMKRRFIEEARTATRLKHANIATIHDFALDEEGKAYLVMEFIDGVNLADLLIRKGPPGLGLSLEIAHQTLLALGYLHRKAIVHRDIAPDNLMLTYDDDSQPIVKLIDLGIAKSLDRPGDMTTTGVFLGKLKYASPEQFGSLSVGEKLDARSDLYSFGVVLYEMLTGVRPFVGESPTEMLRAHLFSPPIPFSQSDPDGKVPAEVRAAVLRALQKRREDRFLSADEFDREVVSLKQRFARPDELEGATKILSTIQMMPSAPGAEITVTPSAQDRLDLHFAASATPLPASAGPIAVPPPSPQASNAETGEHAGSPAGAARPRSRLLLLLAGAVTLLAGFVAVRSWTRRPAPIPAASPTAAVLSTPAASTAREPEATVPAVQNPETTAAAVEESVPTPIEQPTAPPAATAVPRGEDQQLLKDATNARILAGDARRRAEAARAPRYAGALYEAGRAKEKEGRRLLARGQYASARAVFEAGTLAFGNAETVSRARPSEQPTSSPRIAALPEPTARPEPPRLLAVPTHAVEVPRAEHPRPTSSVPTEIPRREASDQERIRDTIRRYVEAQNSLDADLYARIYPSVNRARVQAAFESLRSQTMEFEVQGIRIAPGGTQAEVHGHEKRVVVPRVGTEQHDSRNTIIHLEKRGDVWVISSLT